MSSKPEIEPPTMLNEPLSSALSVSLNPAFFLRFPVFVRNKHTKRFGSVFINSNNAAIVSAYVGKHCELEIVAEFTAFHKAPRIHGFRRVSVVLTADAELAQQLVGIQSFQLTHKRVMEACVKPVRQGDFSVFESGQVDIAFNIIRVHQENVAQRKLFVLPQIVI